MSKIIGNTTTTPFNISGSGLQIIEFVEGYGPTKSTVVGATFSPDLENISTLTDSITVGSLCFNASNGVMLKCTKIEGEIPNLSFSFKCIGNYNGAKGDTGSAGADGAKGDKLSFIYNSGITYDISGGIGSTFTYTDIMMEFDENNVNDIVLKDNYAFEITEFNDVVPYPEITFTYIADLNGVPGATPFYSDSGIPGASKTSAVGDFLYIEEMPTPWSAPGFPVFDIATGTMWRDAGWSEEHQSTRIECVGNYNGNKVIDGHDAGIANKEVGETFYLPVPEETPLDIKIGDWIFTQYNLFVITGKQKITQGLLRYTLLCTAKIIGDKGDKGDDGHSPVITATKTGKVTTIKVDDSAIATINDGVDGSSTILVGGVAQGQVSFRSDPQMQIDDKAPIQIMNMDNLLLTAKLHPNQYHNGTAHDSSSYSYFEIPVTSGKTYVCGARHSYISKSGAIISNGADKGYQYTADFTGTLYVTFYNAATYRPWVFYESTADGTLVGSYEIPAFSADLIKQTVGNSKVCVMSQNAINTALKERDDSISALASADVSITREMEYHNIVNYLNPAKITSGHFMRTNGSPSANANYFYTDYIAVSPGDVVRTYRRESTNTKLLNSRTSSNEGGYSKFPYVTAYNSSKVVQSTKGGETVLDYVVPDGVYYIIVTLRTGKHNNDLGMVTINQEPTEYASYGDRYTIKPSMLDGAFSNKTEQPVLSKGFATVSGNLANGETLTLPLTNTKKNVRYSFFANITAFNKILIGQGKNVYDGSWLTVTNTNADISNYASSETKTQHTHELTISDYIFVEIRSSNPYEQKVDISIISNGSEYVLSDVAWSGDGNGDYFVESEGSTLTNCTFTFGSADFRKVVWIMGDSYLGMASTSRWCHYLIAPGYINNVLLNGYPGENPTASLTGFINSLNYYGRPYYAVWAQGMNGTGDTTSAINSDWLNKTKNFIAYCKEYHITPILATIPTVPDRLHEKRNEWIRNSGYRYIDFAKAVNAQADGTWLSGTLSTDNVHPTELGAKLLYKQAIMDCPEITLNINNNEII